MKLYKDGTTYELTDKTQIDAFLGSGWRYDNDSGLQGEHRHSIDATPEQYNETIISELRGIAAGHGIDVSDCETREDIYEAFIAFGQKPDGGDRLPDDTMTIPQLKQYAAGHGIDIGNATLKPDILRIIAEAIKQGGE